MKRRDSDRDEFDRVASEGGFRAAAVKAVRNALAAGVDPRNVIMTLCGNGELKEPPRAHGDLLRAVKALAKARKTFSEIKSELSIGGRYLATRILDWSRNGALAPDSPVVVMARDALRRDYERYDVWWLIHNNYDYLLSRLRNGETLTQVATSYGISMKHFSAVAVAWTLLNPDRPFVPLATREVRQQAIDLARDGVPVEKIAERLGRPAEIIRKYLSTAAKRGARLPGSWASASGGTAAGRTGQKGADRK